jgi:hypothetical protein
MKLLPPEPIGSVSDFVDRLQKHSGARRLLFGPERRSSLARKAAEAAHRLWNRYPWHPTLRQKCADHPVELGAAWSCGSNDQRDKGMRQPSI